ncbi:MAG: hypothetical protein J7639_33075 [Paenibacillaceae bacterium]|nr:hypothetical protein [Paenibacillaceae bacterium]
MVQIEICRSNGQWSRFTAFYTANRTRIIPNYRVDLAVRDVKNYMKQGRGAILVNEAGEVIGNGCFTLGQQEDGFGDPSIAVLGNSYFEEEYRQTKTFVRGLQVLAEQIADANPDVREVRIPAQAENDYTNRLYRKLAEKHHSYESDYGTCHVYSTPFREFAAFCDRFR